MKKKGVSDDGLNARSYLIELSLFDWMECDEAHSMSFFHDIQLLFEYFIRCG